MHPTNVLDKGYRTLAFLRGIRPHPKNVIQVSGGKISNLHLSHYKQNISQPHALFVHADPANELGARPLHELKIIGVVNNTAGIRIFHVNALMKWRKS